MRILAVSDTEARYFFDFYSPGRFDGIDLIIACGDLHIEYLEFLVTMSNLPLLYVHGNHDEHYSREPEGCVCIDDRLYVYNGIRILGLGGSYRYRDGKYMYTENQMKSRIRKLWYPLKKHKGFDILVTHAPARRVNDLDTVTHRGFECFNSLIDKYKPSLFLHGHIHRNYGFDIPQRTLKDETLIINACEYCIVDYPVDDNVIASLS